MQGRQAGIADQARGIGQHRGHLVAVQFHPDAQEAGVGDARQDGVELVLAGAHARLRPRGRGGSRLAPGPRPALESSMKAAWAAATGSSGSSS